MADARARHLVFARRKITQPKNALAIGDCSEAFVPRAAGSRNGCADYGQTICIRRGPQQGAQHWARPSSRYALLLRRITPARAGNRAQQQNHSAKEGAEIACHGHLFAQALYV